MTITELSIKRPTLIIVLFTFLGVLGIYGYTQLNYDLMPKMSFPVVFISTVYPGASPYEVETSVTKKIEDAVSGIDKISSVTSTSSEGVSFVVIEFEQSANIDIAVQDAQRKINQVRINLPDDVKDPTVSKISMDEVPVLKMSIQSNMATREFYQFVKDRVQPRLAQIAGVGNIVLIGGEEREIRVNVDPEKIRSLGISLNQVAAAIKMANLDFPTGKVQDQKAQFIVRVAGKFTSVDEMRDLVVSRSKAGGDILLGDIAEVQDGSKEIVNFNRFNGVNSIGITVQKQSDANTVEVSAKTRAELEKLEKEYTDIGLKFSIASDGSTFIMDSANAVKEDLLLAVLLVAFVMLIFLHSIRNSVIVMVAIPASLISTFFAMYLFGFTLNLMTLLAMSLVIGILVDDSIVVLENIYRHLEMGDNQVDAAIKGRNEIGFAALSITMVDVVVFIPLALISGVIGDFLRQYSLVIVFSTLMSLLVSFTITPLLASRFTKLQELTDKTVMGRFGKWFESFFDRIIYYYKKTMHWCLEKPWHALTVLFVAFVIFITSFMLPANGFIGMEFMPSVDRGELNVTLELDPGTSIQNLNYVTQAAEAKLRELPEVDKILANVGASTDGFAGSTSNNNSELTVSLVPRSQRKLSTDDLTIKMKEKLMSLPGIKVRIQAVGLMGSSTRSPIQIVVTGTSFDDVSKAAKKAEALMKTIKGTSDVRLSSEDGKPELKVIVDRKKMAQLGLSITDVGGTMNTAFTGNDDSKFREGINEYDIRVMLDKFDRTDAKTVENMPFVNSKGQIVELKQFAEIVQSSGPTKLERRDRISSITLYSNAFGRTSGVIASEFMEKKKALDMPKGVEMNLIGEQKYFAESMLNMVIALFAGILFVYMIMVALYDSFVYPFVVLFSIPLAVIGAFYGLALTSKSISIYSMLGIIMLVGLVAKNAILLVDRANQMKIEKGLSTVEALTEAGQTRLRPILMTTFSMIMGMMPIAVSTAAGGEAKSALGVVLIGGLASSMFMTLLVVPVVYRIVDHLRAKFWHGKKADTVPTL